MRTVRRRALGPQGVGPGTIKRGLVRTNVHDDAKKTTSYGVSDQLQSILNNPDTPANSRVIAVRTLAEIQGLIGRHQAAPERASSPVHALSRDALVTELERLRTLVDLGLLD
jgi:hypothetical protein